MSVKRTHGEFSRAPLSSLGSSITPQVAPIDDVKRQILKCLLGKRLKPAQNDAEFKLEAAVNRKRLARVRWNKKYVERTGRRITMCAIDHVKRLAAENDHFDSYKVTVFQTLEELRDKFLLELSIREEGLKNGKVDADEQAGVERSKKQRLWLDQCQQLIERECKADSETGLLEFKDWESAENHLRQIKMTGTLGAAPASIRVLEPTNGDEPSLLLDEHVDELENEEEMLESDAEDDSSLSEDESGNDDEEDSYSEYESSGEDSDTNSEDE
ncbi:hypothetical protein HDE_00859 [Halotydeus destructor]|nr:hypothetical protein HDE_00859 [Halotydeus destructor]